MAVTCDTITYLREVFSQGCFSTFYQVSFGYWNKWFNLFMSGDLLDMFLLELLAFRKITWKFWSKYSLNI